MDRRGGPPILVTPPSNVRLSHSSLLISQSIDQISSFSNSSVKSEYFMSKEEIEEVAHGLEFSEVNFIWVIRFPEGEETKVDKILPPGFLERIGERGMVVEGWAPQMTILGHRSIGGFVSHCGWSSVREAMKLGVPLIAMPVHIDQPLNARWMVEHGVAVEVQRDQKGNLARGEIAKVIKQVVVDKGSTVRRMKEIKDIRTDKGEDELDVVVACPAPLVSVGRERHLLQCREYLYEMSEVLLANSIPSELDIPLC